MHGISFVMIVAMVGRDFVPLVLSQSMAVVERRLVLNPAAVTNKPTLKAKNLPTEHHQREERGESGPAVGGHGGDSNGAMEKIQSRRTGGNSTRSEEIQ